MGMKGRFNSEREFVYLRVSDKYLLPASPPIDTN